MTDFDSWRKLVDKLVWRIVGCSLDDLPDVALRDWFDDGLSPQQAARRAVRHANDEDEDD